MRTVALRAFEARDLPVVMPWFAHPDQREFAHDLPARELELRRTMPGTEHRARTSSHATTGLQATMPAFLSPS